MSLLRDLIATRQPARSGGGYDDLGSALINGIQYALGAGMSQTLGTKIEDIDVGYTSLVHRAYMQNPVVFACMRVRRDLFTEARFGYQNMRGGVAGDFYGDRDQPKSNLAVLDHPWPGATTGDLLKYQITDNDLAGNAFVARRKNRLVRLRPDWTQIIHGSPDPNGNMWDLDAELVGYSYQPGGAAFGRPWVFLQPTEVAHFSTTPDPLLPVRGMSWLTPLVREIMADEAMTAHRLKYFEHGGTPNLVLKTQYTDLKKLREFMDMVRQEHAGVVNAYKMMGFTAGVDATVVGSDLKQLDFKVVQGGGETRIASDAGVPAILAGLSEGLQGSSLNAGQGFSASMRLFADLTMSSAWRNVAGSLESIIPPPTGARLWFDIRGIPALKDDIKSAAEVQALQSTAIRTLTDGGYDAESVVDAIVSGDLKRLTHTGLLSVQLNPPNTTPKPDQAPAPMPDMPSPAVQSNSREDFLLEMLRRTSDRPEVHFTASPITVNTPDVTVTTPDVNVTIERGAVEVSNPVTITTPEVTVNTPEIRNEITVEAASVMVEPPVVNVTTPEVTVNMPEVTVTVEPTPVEVRNEISVEPTPVTIENAITVEPTPVEITNAVSVEPTPVTITNELPEPRSVTKRIVRDAKNQITEIVEESTDG